MASIKASSQKIDTTIKGCTAAPIIPFTYSIGIPSVSNTITHLGVFNYTDDLKGNCIANWALISNGVNIVLNSYTLTVEDYEKWDSSPEGLLAIIGKYLGVTFK